jgi:hypothetical protein
MNQTATTYLDKLLDPVTSRLTSDMAQHLAELPIDTATQARLDELAEKSTEGELSEDERAEYETYVHALDFLAVLQAQARQVLDR